MDDKLKQYLSVAELMSTFSKDRSTKVGAIAVDDKFNILVTGYNGFPRGVDDDVESRHARPAKYLWTSHAEENLVAQSAYMGISLRGSTVLVTSIPPCATCARLLVQSGVSKVVIAEVAPAHWEESITVAMTIFQEAGVEIIFQK